MLKKPDFVIHCIVGSLSCIIGFIIGANIIQFLPIPLPILDEYHVILRDLILGSFMSWCCTFISFLIITRRNAFRTCIGSIIGLTFSILLLFSIPSILLFYINMTLIFAGTLLGYVWSPRANQGKSEGSQQSTINAAATPKGSAPDN
jgi:hypothetical protein